MRTRLDEIVEEEIDRFVFGDKAQIYLREVRIAERAFRHGVELGQYAGWIACKNGHGVFTGQEVQPAPAEEKPCNRVGCGWVQGPHIHAAAHVEEKCPDECWHGRNSWLHGLHIPLPDRRKGERRVDNSRYDARIDCYASMRPGGEARMHTHSTGLGRSGDGPVYEWLPNRRGLWDRRGKWTS